MLLRLMRHPSTASSGQCTGQTDFVTVAPPGGESFHRLHSRVVSALLKIDCPKAGSLLVATHAGVIRAAVCAFLDLTLDRAFELDVPCGSTTCLRWNDHWSVTELPWATTIEDPS